MNKKTLFASIIIIVAVFFLLFPLLVPEQSAEEAYLPQPIDIFIDSKYPETTPYDSKTGPFFHAEIVETLKIKKKVKVNIRLKKTSDDYLLLKSFHTSYNSDDPQFISREDIKILQDNFISSFSSKEFSNIELNLNFSEDRPKISATINQAGLEFLRSHPLVDLVEINPAIVGQLAQSGALIGATSVHEYNGYTGKGVVIAVIDSGVGLKIKDSGEVQYHQGLENKIIWEECFSEENICSGDSPRDSGFGSAKDTKGHGTQVIGVIASQSNLYEGEIYQGIAPDVKIIAIKVGISLNNIEKAVNWVIDNKYKFKNEYGAIKIINISLATIKKVYFGNCDDKFGDLYNAFKKAKEADIITFAASGNHGHIDAIGMPACLTPVISVGAIYDGIAYEQLNKNEDNIFICDKDDSFSLFLYKVYENQVVCDSNASKSLDLLAPGAWIRSTYINGDYKNDIGTSLASPHAAGVAALMLEKNSNLKPDEIKNILSSTGTTLEDYRYRYGESAIYFPAINAVAAIDAVPDPDQGNTMAPMPPILR